MLSVNDDIQIPLRDLNFSFVRSSGPGGQNVNKVATKAVMHWDVTGSEHMPEAVRERFLKTHARRINKEGQLVLSSQRFRDQGRNVGDCLAKLRDLILAVATVPKPRKKSKPSRAAKARRLQQKRQQSEKKQRRKAVKWKSE